MGRADMAMTMRYSHPTPESKRNAVDLLSNENSSGTSVALEPFPPSDDKIRQLSNSVNEA